MWEAAENHLELYENPGSSTSGYRIDMHESSMLPTAPSPSPVVTLLDSRLNTCLF